MPTDHGVRLNEDERAPPLLQHPHHREPEDAVAVLDVRPPHAALVDGELVTERDVLKGELRAILDCELEQRDE